MKIHKFLIALVLLITFIGCSKDDPAVADFTWSPHDPKVGEVVRFNNLSNYQDGTIWTFGDPDYTKKLKDGSYETSMSGEIHPSHVYENPGIYVIKLDISHWDGMDMTEDFAIKTITVTE